MTKPSWSYTVISMFYYKPPPFTAMLGAGFESLNALLDDVVPCTLATAIIISGVDVLEVITLATMSTQGSLKYVHWLKVLYWIYYFLWPIISFVGLNPIFNTLGLVSSICYSFVRHRVYFLSTCIFFFFLSR